MKTPAGYEKFTHIHRCIVEKHTSEMGSILSCEYAVGNLFAYGDVYDLWIKVTPLRTWLYYRKIDALIFPLGREITPQEIWGELTELLCWS